MYVFRPLISSQPMETHLSTYSSIRPSIHPFCHSLLHPFLHTIRSFKDDLPRHAIQTHLLPLPPSRAGSSPWASSGLCVGHRYFRAFALVAPSALGALLQTCACSGPHYRLLPQHCLLPDLFLDRLRQSTPSPIILFLDSG